MKKKYNADHFKAPSLVNRLSKMQHNTLSRIKKKYKFKINVIQVSPSNCQPYTERAP